MAATQEVPPPALGLHFLYPLEETMVPRVKMEDPGPPCPEAGWEWDAAGKAPLVVQAGTISDLLRWATPPQVRSDPIPQLWEVQCQEMVQSLRTPADVVPAPVPVPPPAPGWGNLQLPELAPVDDIEAYLSTFERAAETCQWPRDPFQCPQILSLLAFSNLALRVTVRVKVEQVSPQEMMLPTAPWEPSAPLMPHPECVSSGEVALHQPAPGPGLKMPCIPKQEPQGLPETGALMANGSRENPLLGSSMSVGNPPGNSQENPLAENREHCKANCKGIAAALMLVTSPPRPKPVLLMDDQQALGLQQNFEFWFTEDSAGMRIVGITVLLPEAKVSYL
ncbi:hypothetical protein JD844_001654 [Phrynosoma platyrhinos]|uniref:Uncharacterized protein n=1 Tax=Phrynosoma platyrhinos TaxID=52577 RepID=A0ABQ7TAM5_PHRPL|nr:hypothetical protein JD844_001654 [Phrynosoma platyrhinos]